MEFFYIMLCDLVSVYGCFVSLSGRVVFLQSCFVSLCSCSVSLSVYVSLFD